MAISSYNPEKTHDEREMSRHQRGLVDTCFEEGQYEAGMHTLEQLRSAGIGPSIPHVRQLLYIALYPPTPDSGKDNDRVFTTSPVKASPSKNNYQHKSVHIPSPTATEAAQRLLRSFLIINSPMSIHQALPQYRSNAENGIFSQPGILGGEGDSIIARESACISESKHCWTILRERFIQRKTVFVTLRKGNKRSGRSNNHEHEEEASCDEVETSPPLPVADHAWPVLDLLILLYEKDELWTERSGLPRYSPLLLSQIPPSRFGSGPRWDADALLDIVWQALSQTKGTMGFRLMTLLINLASSTQFDANIFITSVATRLFSSTTEFCTTFFSHFPDSPTVLAFKVALYRKYLADVFPTSSSEQAKQRPKPQARRTARRHDVAQEDLVSSTSGADSLTSPNRLALPSATEILELILKHHTDAGLRANHSHFYAVKYQLLLAYNSLLDSLPVEQRDSDWRDMIFQGKLKQTVTSTFPQAGEGKVYREALLAWLSLGGSF